MDTVNGNDVLLLVGNDVDNPTEWTPVVCLTNVAWGRNKTTTATATKCGTFKSNGSTDYTPTASGLIIENAGLGNAGHVDLINLFTSDEKQWWRIAPADPVAGNIIRQFKGSVTTLNDAFPTDALSTFDLTLNPDPTTVTEAVFAIGTVNLATIAVAAGNVSKNTTNNILYVARITGATAATAAVEIVALPTTGTYDSGDLGNIKVYSNTAADMTGTPTLLSTVAGGAQAGPHTFGFSANVSLEANQVVYLIYTADIATGADTGHTIKAGVPTFNITSDATVANALTDTAGTKTIIA
jgi:hypothetical protein